MNKLIYNVFFFSQQEQPPQDEVLSQPVSSSPRPPISKCGDLVLSLEYRPDTEKLLVSVVAARDIPDKARSGMDSWQVHMVLLPSKKQRQKTSVQKGSLPHFNETFRFSRLDPSELHMSAIRFRLYALGGRMSRERMMGEKMLRLGGLDPDGGTMETTLVLEPRSNLKVTCLDVALLLLAVTLRPGRICIVFAAHCVCFCVVSGCGLPAEPVRRVSERQRLVHSVSDPRRRPRAAGGSLLQRHHGTHVCGAHQGQPLQKPGHQQTAR